VLVESADAAEQLGFELGTSVRRLADAFWPGPLTMVVASSGGLLAGIARADGAVGLRCSAHPLATALARRLTREGVAPVTATSLNRKGERPARTREHAAALCGDGEDEPRLLDIAAEAGGDEASTVVDATGGEIEVLRWGALSKAALAPFLEDVISS
jgi:L-threonylcarbamoyladenylate synthase